MAAMPAHQPLLDDDTDEELTHAQVRHLLTEAGRRARESASHDTSEAAFKLPKLQPGHIADTFSSTVGAVTKLDASKLLSQIERTLANGVKKIEDPVQLKRLKKEVCSYIAFFLLPVMITFPITTDADHGPVLGTTCIADGFSYHSYTEAFSILQRT